MKNNPNKQEECDVLPDDLLRDIARLKGHAPQKGVPVATAILYPVSAAMRRKAEEELAAALSGNADPSAFIGQEMPGCGVFIGTWQPEGLSLKFTVYAAKEDLTNTAGKNEMCTYEDTVRRISRLKNWQGFDGTNYKTDKDFYKALKDGSYIKEGSGWFIPPRELLTGTAANGAYGPRQKGTAAQPGNLYDHQFKGALRGNFCKAVARDDYDFANCYWSSTESPDERCRWIANFSDGYESQCQIKIGRVSCRPVRLELVS